MTILQLLAMILASLAFIAATCFFVFAGIELFHLMWMWATDEDGWRAVFGRLFYAVILGSIGYQVLLVVPIPK